MKKYKDVLIGLSILLIYSIISNLLYFIQNSKWNFYSIKDHIILAIIMIIVYNLLGTENRRK